MLDGFGMVNRVLVATEAHAIHKDRLGALDTVGDARVLSRIRAAEGFGASDVEDAHAKRKDAVAAFYDANIGPNQLRVTCEETFPSSSPTEIAYILVLETAFPNDFVATVRGVFTYRVDDAGLITNLRGYWNMDAMTFSQPESTD